MAAKLDNFYDIDKFSQEKVYFFDKIKANTQFLAQTFA